MMLLSEVRVIDSSYVALPATTTPPPEPIKLTAMEAQWATPPWSTAGQNHLRYSRRWTFNLEKQDIEHIKQKLIHLGKSNGVPLPLPSPPSTFVIIAALAWTCFARCKPFAADDDVFFFFFFADVRSRFNPPVDIGYIGACLTGCLTRLPARELHGEHALSTAAYTIQDEVHKMKEDPMAGWDFVTSLLTVDVDRLMHVSGSSGFRAYEVGNFGWGEPRWVENARMNDDGHVALMGAKNGHGVQMSVSLVLQSHMDEFKTQFLKLLQA